MINKFFFPVKIFLGSIWVKFLCWLIKTIKMNTGDPLRYVGIKFCPECNNMLYPQEDKERRKLQFACRHCDFRQDDDSNCIYVNKLIQDVDELRHIVPEIYQDPTLPTTEEHPCPVCGNQQSVFFHAQTRKAEDEMRLYYACKNPECCHRWCE
ncbi:DNA-directed RNA polymerase II subunit RPB9 [Strongyloides ratti]|uniref:DNA-directed RNA polymerase II subunit RPB9 n=1 Tax=Strongyloides ratti TaxID=34506 RepID=A0A090LKN8_STRRB|nr:DNA-directed RNA polymerase II subunit RPB9 [Strongyloides ratti]CEF68125.1 DNA-directed RNA polymerase II subunit RPB9 [Strongyloides ratti]